MDSWKSDRLPVSPVPMHVQERSKHPSLGGLPGRLCSRPGAWGLVLGVRSLPRPRRVWGQAVPGERKTKNPRAIQSAV